MSTLSPRQYEVFVMTGNGFATKQIAAMIGLAVKTVEVYKHQIKIKLGLDNGLELTVVAVRYVLENRLEHPQGIVQRRINRAADAVGSVPGVVPEVHESAISTRRTRTGATSGRSPYLRDGMDGVPDGSGPRPRKEQRGKAVDE